MVMVAVHLRIQAPLWLWFARWRSVRVVVAVSKTGTNGPCRQPCWVGQGRPGRPAAGESGGRPRAQHHAREHEHGCCWRGRGRGRAGRGRGAHLCLHQLKDFLSAVLPSHLVQPVAQAAQHAPGAAGRPARGQLSAAQGRRVHAARPVQPVLQSVVGGRALLRESAAQRGRAVGASGPAELAHADARTAGAASAERPQVPHAAVARRRACSPRPGAAVGGTRCSCSRPSCGPAGSAASGRRPARSRGTGGRFPPGTPGPGPT
jgi:hypothetical protein